MEKFSGPLFIVGSGRSGTKLLREILNNHINIALADEWVNLVDIIQFIKKHSLDDSPDSLIVIFNIFKKSYFYWRQKEIVKKEISLDYLLDRCNSKKSMLEEICRFYAYGLQNIKNQRFIWGNKTPTYVKH